MIGCLIIHGYTGGPYEVEPLANYLKDNTDWYVKVPTLPGHGKELKLEGASYKSWIQTAEEELQSLINRCDTVYVIGFSMGGMIASYLAAKYKIHKLVLLATSGKYLSLKQMGLDIADMVGDGLRGNLKENQLFQHYKKKMGVVPLKAHFEFMKLVRFTRKYLDKVKSPVLIAQGQLDGIVPYKTAYYLDKEIHSEKKEVVFFERSKHLICLGTDKDTLNGMVYDFLTEAPA
ncbi:carboxylesterase [Oceanobacillus sp. J11TS1]|uniref:alpha/beta hydrolase n=1 Tax=Oceanobacillus sp. J11TS1 TaxID=2807191 RepID=UPI001B1F6CBD|nr:alpha/beta fold hydrolase [Oceanobacillus sp. J11TS1]GIO24336.1 carboxylesterase [Oceanobacillus sp. J11TS1]